MVVEAVAQIVADMSRHPLRQIALKAIQDGGQQSQPEQHQRCREKIRALSARDALVDNLLNNARHQKREPRQRDEDQQTQKNLHQIRFDE